MRRLVQRLCLPAVLIVAIAATETTATVAQERPVQPQGGGVQPMRPCYPDCEDVTPPVVELWEPWGEVTTEYPHIEIQFCDNWYLNAGSRVIRVNGVDRTAEFAYVSPGFAECGGGEEKHSNTTSVPLVYGPNEIYAYICDTSGNCSGEYFSVNRPAPPPAPQAPVRVLARGLCLTIAAGPSAAYECGDLLVVHPLPAVRTLGQVRAPTLLYNSQHAHPFLSLNADLTLAAYDRPDSIVVLARINAGSGFAQRVGARGPAHNGDPPARPARAA